MSRRHGLEDRIVLVNERSYRARIDEPVDVIVTETFWNPGSAKECWALCSTPAAAS